MPKRVVIHAGPGKTGTSAIQFWLRENHDALRKAGVLYPKHRLDSNSIGSGNVGAVAVRSPVGSWSVADDKVQALRARFERSGCHTLLLSSEFFFELIPQLHEAFRGPRFVAYLRDPLELLESTHVQVIKRHCGLRSFALPRQVRFDALVRIDELLQSLPDLDLVLRPYEASLYAGGNITADLLSVVGAELQVTADPRINTRYTFEALEFKRLANHYPLGSLDKRLDRALQRCEVGTTHYSLTDPAQRAAVLPQILQQLEDFLARRDAPALRPYREHLAASRPAPRPTLPVPEAALEAVAEHVRAVDPTGYQELATLVHNHPDQAVPSPWFPRHFGLAAADPAVRGAAFAALARSLRAADCSEDATLFAELAGFCTAQGRPAAAELFWEAALCFRPEDRRFQEQLARARWSRAAAGTTRPVWRRLLDRLKVRLGRS